ncbi:unnamed protein product [Paramecium sonneborni]|uniref:Uncharacterized protein n=1 Tax=Paramecium sonneborni TaxID=65129 RepID=A0A8S1P7Z6_9CILI|nr:unnamed protein product [Paramecium sonneborni]
MHRWYKYEGQYYNGMKLIVVYMMDYGKIIKLMDLVNIHVQIQDIMKDIGKII